MQANVTLVQLYGRSLREKKVRTVLTNELEPFPGQKVEEGWCLRDYSSQDDCIKWRFVDGF